MKAEDYRVPETVCYDEKIRMHLIRTRCFDITERWLIAKREYTIGGEIYEVNSVFDLDSHKNADDYIVSLMKKEYEKGLDFQNG